MQKVSLEDINIRHSYQISDTNKVLVLHAKIYSDEYGYGENFTEYVFEGLIDFARAYDPSVDRVWACEHNGNMVGFLLGMHRGDENQLRYFVIDKEYRGIGLGKKLMSDYVSWAEGMGYQSSYLWTTSELEAAASLYKRFGFALTEEEESERFGKRVTEQKYELKFNS